MRTFIVTFVLAFFYCFSFSQISTFPHLETFTNETVCTGICGNACNLTLSWKNASQVGVSGSQSAWVADAGGTSSAATGPSADHTQGTSLGKYLYTESSGQCSFSTAMVVSPWYDFSNLTNPELSFWYHMYGAAMGTMHVDVQQGANGSWVQNVVPQWTDNDTVWKYRSVLLSGSWSVDSVRFRIRGVTGSSFTSDMAIDDIRVGPPPVCDLSVTGSNILNGTGLSSSHPVAITVENRGLDTVFAGDTIPVCYRRDAQTPVCENFILQTDLLPAASQQYYFAQPANLAGPTFNFQAWTNFGCDQLQANDTLFVVITNNLTPYPCDVEILSSNVEIGYGLTDTQAVSIVIRSNGSDTLMPGDTLPVCYQVLNQSQVCEDFVLTSMLLPGDTVSYQFQTPADLSDFQFTFWTWTDLPCDADSTNDTLTVISLANYPPAYTCTYMWVDIYNGPIRPCGYTHIYVSYQNQGIDTAFDVSVKVGIDTSLVSFNSTLTAQHGLYPDSIYGDTLCFNLGTVLPTSNPQRFWFTVDGICDTNIVGQTACFSAHIYPDTFCTPPNQNWDRSSVSILGECMNDSLVCFTISNTGSAQNGNMTGPTDWRMYVNNQLAQSGTLQLCGGCDTVLCWPGAGNTLRLEVDQRPGHPGNSHPNAVVEGCGNPNQVTGMVNQLPPDDGDHFFELYCREVVLSYDPNAKSVIPSGTTVDHIVAPNSQLEYTIQFQNTGTDTAFNIVIHDTLSAYLDASSVQFGIMTHHGTAQANGNVLTWTFPNILLPDSTTNEPGSHGAVKFRINPVAGLPDGTVINNDAAIIFDINTPVITNTAFVTLGDPIQLGNEPTPYTEDLTIHLWPNPAKAGFQLQLEGAKASLDYEVEIYDLLGNQMGELSGKGTTPVRFQRTTEKAGIYVYLIRAEGRVVGAGKFILQ